MAATVKIGGDARELIRQIQALQKELDTLKNQGFKENTRASRELERVGKKAFESTRTAAEKYTITQKQLLAAVKAGKITLDTYNRSVDQAARELREATQETEKFSGSVSKQALTIGSSFLTVSAAISQVRETFQLWIEDIREAGQEVEDISSSATTFAALQAPGTAGERVQQVLREGAGAFERPAEALDLVQSLQSASGSFEQGVDIFREIVAGTRAGLPSDVGAEAAIQALTVGEDPIRALQLTLAAGQASGRSAAEVGLAAPGLAAFGDEREFGFAAAAQLSGQFGRRVETYTRQAGRALSSISGLFDTFEKLGVGEGATREQRVAALAAAGIDTAEEVQQAGLTETRQIDAIVNLVNAFQTRALQQIQEGIAERVELGRELFPTIQAQVEEDVPFIEAAGRRRELEAERERIRIEREGAGEASAFEARLALELERQGVGALAPGGRVQFGATARAALLQFNPITAAGRSIAGDEALPVLRAIRDAITGRNETVTVPQAEAGAQ